MKWGVVILGLSTIALHAMEDEFDFDKELDALDAGLDESLFEIDRLLQDPQLAQRNTWIERVWKRVEELRDQKIPIPDEYVQCAIRAIFIQHEADVVPSSDEKVKNLFHLLGEVEKEGGNLPDISRSEYEFLGLLSREKKKDSGKPDGKSEGSAKEEREKLRRQHREKREADPEEEKLSLETKDAKALQQALERADGLEGGATGGKEDRKGKGKEEEERSKSEPRRARKSSSERRNPDQSRIRKGPASHSTPVLPKMKRRWLWRMVPAAMVTIIAGKHIRAVNEARRAEGKPTLFKAGWLKVRQFGNKLRTMILRTQAA